MIIPGARRRAVRSPTTSPAGWTGIRPGSRCLESEAGSGDGGLFKCSVGHEFNARWRVAADVYVFYQNLTGATVRHGQRILVSCRWRDCALRQDEGHQQSPSDRPACWCHGDRSPHPVPRPCIRRLWIVRSYLATGLGRMLAVSLSCPVG